MTYRIIKDGGLGASLDYGDWLVGRGDEFPVILNAMGALGAAPKNALFYRDDLGILFRYDVTVGTWVDFSGGTGIVYDVTHFGAIGDGVTDDTDAVEEAVSICGLTGGTVYFPPGTYKLQPGCISLGYNTTGVTRTKPLRLIGSGVDWRTTLGSNDAASGGTILDFQGAPLGQGVGCIELFGTGGVEISGLFFTQLGVAHTVPFIYYTNANALIHGNAFVGHNTKSGLTCDQDAILLGGTGAQVAIDGTTTSRFQGYGTVIRENYFNRMRRCVWVRRSGNDVSIEDNCVWNACGSDGGSAAASGAAFEVQGINTSSTVGTKILNNLLEVGGYYYGIRLGDYTASATVLGNGFYDEGVQTVAYVKCSATNSLYHTIIAGYHPDALPFVEDSSGQSTIVNPHSSQTSYFRQLVEFTNNNSTGGLKSSGTAVFAGGSQGTKVQPDADQIEGAKLFIIKRSALDDVNPGGEIFSITNGGDIAITNSANAEVQLVSGGKTWQAVGSGGTFLIYTGSGGSNLDVRGAGLRLLKTSDAAELIRFRASPNSSSVGAIQFNGTGPIFTTHTATPEGVITAPIGSICVNTAGGAGTTLYVKESGAGNTGWVGK